MVSIFPDRESVIRLVGSLLIEQDNEWAAEKRRYMSEAGFRKLAERDELARATAGMAGTV